MSIDTMVPSCSGWARGAWAASAGWWAPSRGVRCCCAPGPPLRLPSPCSGAACRSSVLLLWAAGLFRASRDGCRLWIRCVLVPFRFRAFVPDFAPGAPFFSPVRPLSFASAAPPSCPLGCPWGVRPARLSVGALLEHSLRHSAPARPTSGPADALHNSQCFSVRVRAGVSGVAPHGLLPLPADSPPPFGTLAVSGAPARQQETFLLYGSGPVLSGPSKGWDDRPHWYASPRKGTVGVALRKGLSGA